MFIETSKILFTGHAVKRMFERSINRREVQDVLENGEIVADYPDDQPFASGLMLGFVDERPIHVVVAVESETKT